MATIGLAPIPTGSPTREIEIDAHWSTYNFETLATETRSADSDERWQDVIETSRDSKTLQDPLVNELSAFVRRQVEQSVEDGKRREVQENEDKILRLGRRLSETSNEKNIDDMASFLGGMTGKRKQAAADVDVLQPFDVTTAQIDSVRKEVDSEGKVYYVAKLIDENGTFTDLELDSESGEQLYRTMKIIESNPLLKSVYRKIVMGFLDQMLNQPTPH